LSVSAGEGDGDAVLADLVRCQRAGSAAESRHHIHVGPSEGTGGRVAVHGAAKTSACGEVIIADEYGIGVLEVGVKGDVDGAAGSRYARQSYRGE